MMVMKKPTKPSIVMATKPLVTMSHSNGDFILSNCPKVRGHTKAELVAEEAPKNSLLLDTII